MPIKDKDNYEKAFNKATKEAATKDEPLIAVGQSSMDEITDGNLDETKPSFYPKRTRLKTVNRKDL